MKKYPVSVKWSGEDDAFIAIIPGIRGLSAFGASQEEALRELRVAAEAFFESLRSAGRPLPVPETLGPFSGQLRLRMPKSLHAALAESAETDGISLNTYIVTLLSERNALRRKTYSRTSGTSLSAGIREERNRRRA